MIDEKNSAPLYLSMSVCLYLDLRRTGITIGSTFRCVLQEKSSSPNGLFVVAAVFSYTDDGDDDDDEGR